MSSHFTQYEGVPQGCVLSTTLFLLAINNVVATLPAGVRSSLYVDDFTVYTSGSSVSELHSLIQSAVSSASSWATSHGFLFSTSKTYSIFFSRSRQGPPPPVLLYDSPIPSRSSGKFLGLVFDSRLTWRDHILSLKTAALRRLNFLKTLSHLSWGADRKTLLHLHVTLVLSLLDYGCHVYSSASPTLLRLLDPVHHQGLRLALGAFRSSPVESLNAESGFPSLFCRRALLSLRCYSRLHQFSTSKLTLSQPVLDKLMNHPTLPRPFPARMATLLSHSPFPRPSVLPFRFHTSPPLVDPSCLHMLFHAMQL